MKKLIKVSETMYIAFDEILWIEVMTLSKYDLYYKPDIAKDNIENHNKYIVIFFGKDVQEWPTNSKHPHTTEKKREHWNSPIFENEELAINYLNSINLEATVCNFKNEPNK